MDLKILCIAIIIGLASCKIKPEAVIDRPNIIFILSDDHACQAISAYDSLLIKTPSIDRIANEGIKFANASVTNSICAPSRATILTGKHCHINGKIDNRTTFDTTQITFPQIFQENGYQTCIFGKLHFGNKPKGVDDFMILPGQGNYINPDFITSDGDTTIMGYVTDVITDVAINWLEDKRDKDKPFVMMYMHKAPHRPWWPRPDKFREFASKEFPVPETLFDDYKNRGEAAKTAEMNILNHMQYEHDSKIRPETINRMQEVIPEITPFKDGFYGRFDRATEEQKSLYKPTLDSLNTFFEEHWSLMTNKEKMVWKYQRYMQDYLACISSVDDNIGRVLTYLDEEGLAENTLVVYSSDQGFFLGEHGWFDKRFMYNESFKTPLLMRWPKKIKAEIVSNELVQNLDFAPTFLEAANIQIPDDMQGESMMPLLLDEPEEWTREDVYYHYYEYPGPHMVKKHYGIATKDFKLIHFYHDVDEWELYDLNNDPMEMKNEYANEDYQDTVLVLKEQLKQLQSKYNDPIGN